VILQSFKSPFTDSSHLKFGLLLPLFPFPVWLITPLQIGAFGDLHWICPNHFKWCCTNFSLTGVTPNLSCMSSFRARSLLVWLQIDYSMHTSAMLSCWTCRLLLGQHYAPYNMTGRIAVLYNFSFSFCGTLGSHKTPETWCYFNQLTLIIWLTSSSISPSF
jgi:hypothetical protein